MNLAITFLLLACIPDVAGLIIVTLVDFAAAKIGFLDVNMVPFSIVTLLLPASLVLLASLVMLTSLLLPAFLLL